METMRGRGIRAVGGSIVLMLLLPAATSFARPQYKVAFEEAFPSAVQAVTCAYCHPAEDKRERTAFAKKLEAALGERNVKDRVQIVAALKKLVPANERPAAAPAPAAVVVRAGVARAGVMIQQAAPVVQVDDDGNEVLIEVRRFSITHQHLDQLIFGSNKALEAVQREWEAQLTLKLDALQTKYQLDAAQRRKLQLAGRGDIKRFVSLAEALHDQLGPDVSLQLLEQEEYVRLQQTAMALRQRMAAGGGLFDDQSLLSKTVPKSIPPKFAAEYAAEQIRERGQQFETQLEASLASLKQFLMLRDEQKEGLKKLIRSEVPPPVRVNQYLTMWVYYHLSRMPNEKLSNVLDETQITKFGQIKGNAARYEEYLRQYGLLPDAGDESQEKSE